MILYDKYKFAFQHVNRSGGMTVRTAIEDIAGPPDSLSVPLGASHQMMKTRLDRLRSNGIDIDNYSIYANVRNPLHRIVSIYHFRKSRGRYKTLSFKDFFYTEYVKEVSVASGPIHKMLLVDGVLPLNVKVIKLDEIPTHWPIIIFSKFKKLVKLSHLNKSIHKDPMEYYSKRMIKIVKDRESWVIENYYPELLEEI